MCNVTTKYTLWKLLKEYAIEIPLFQRDYAQGRKDSRSESIRKEFVRNLYDAVMGIKEIKLDFIYGSSNDKNKVFIPLDGQQRLTTLWLLHVYISWRCNGVVQNVEENLRRFTYSTRVSSTDFCKKIVEYKLNNSVEDICKGIQNESWFINSWTKDPTVQGMLVMINEIHSLFKDKDIPNDKWITYWHRLTDSDSIYFYVLFLEELKLSEELYIKMNARGRALTDFENWKAQFLHHIKENKSLSDEEIKGIGERFDKEWLDFFFKQGKYVQEENEKNKDEDNLSKLDERYKNFLDNITTMLHAILYLEEKSNEVAENTQDEKEGKEYKQPQNDFEKYRKVYSNDKVIKRVFGEQGILNMFYTIAQKYKTEIQNPNEDKGIVLLYSTIFGYERNSKNADEVKVFLPFEIKEAKETFFSILMKKNLELNRIILLFTTIYILEKYNEESEQFIEMLNNDNVLDTMREIIRIMRNCIWNMPQLWKQLPYQLKFITTFVDNVMQYTYSDDTITALCKAMENISKEYEGKWTEIGFQKQQWEHEVEKIKNKDSPIYNTLLDLENHEIFEGNIHLFLDEYKNRTQDNQLQDKERIRQYKELWYACFEMNKEHNKLDLVRRAMLTFVPITIENNVLNDISSGFLYRDGSTAWCSFCSGRRYSLCESTQEWSKSFNSKSQNYFKLLQALYEKNIDVNNIENALEDIIDKYNEEDNCFYLLIKNPEALKFAERKRIAITENKEVHIIKKIIVRTKKGIEELKNYSFGN